ncbi:MAG: hypothetical protein V4672_18850 [Verrucomicrobiota bacterium]
MTDLVRLGAAVVGFPGAALVVALLLYFRDNLSGSRLYSGPILIGLGVVSTYLLCLGLVFLNPSWEDNGAEEQIRFPDHFLWAWVISILAQFIMTPAVLFVYWLSCKGSAFIRKG